MTVQDLFRVLPSYEEVLFNTKHATDVWHGLVRDIPSDYFDYIIDSIYSLRGEYVSSYIVINFA